MKSLSRAFNRSSKSPVKLDNSGDFPITHVTPKPDKLIETSIKNCHLAFGGTWSVDTYEKLDGTTYATHSINCIKCNRIQNNLYSGPPGSVNSSYKNNDNIKQQNFTPQGTKTQSRTQSSNPRRKTLTPKSMPLNGMYYGVGCSPKKYTTQLPHSQVSPNEKSFVLKLTRHGYNVSPTKNSDSEVSEPSPTSSQDTSSANYKTQYLNEKNASGQMSFKTHEKRRSGTSFYKKR